MTSRTVRARRLFPALLLLLGGARLGAQSPSLWEWGPFSNSPHGIHLYSVWAGSSYFANGAGGNQQSSLYLPIASDVATQSGAMIGWRHEGWIPITITYRPSYISRARFPEFNRFNHDVTLSGGRHQFNGRWGLTLNGTAAYRDMAASAFQSPFFGALGSMPTSLGDLSSAINMTSGAAIAPYLLVGLAGQTAAGGSPTPVIDLNDPRFGSGGLTDSQIASLLTGAPAQVRQSNYNFYDTRVFTSSATVSLDYSASPRMTVNFGVGGTRNQYIDGGSEGAYRPYQRMVGVNAFGSFSYSLTQRTKVGASVNTTRQFSAFQDGYTTTGTAFAERDFRRWFVRGDVGVGQMNLSRSVYAVPTGLRVIWGGSGGYRSRTQMIAASVRSMVGDPYALGGGSTITSTLAWNWRRLGAPWGVFASAARQQLRSTAFQNVNIWQVTGGYQRRLGWNVSVQTQGFWLKYDGAYGPLPYNLNVNGVNVALVWSPEGVNR
jgi:hypothetical protein